MMRLAQDRFKQVDRTYDSNPGLEFECVLPPEVRLELFGPHKLTKPCYKGSLTDESERPVIGNSTGDTWAIGDHLWLWLVEPGTTNAAWIDP